MWGCSSKQRYVVFEAGQDHLPDNAVSWWLVISCEGNLFCVWSFESLMEPHFETSASAAVPREQFKPQAWKVLLAQFIVSIPKLLEALFERRREARVMREAYLHNELSVTLLRLKSKSLVSIKITCRARQAWSLCVPFDQMSTLTRTTNSEHMIEPCIDLK